MTTTLRTHITAALDTAVEPAVDGGTNGYGAAILVRRTTAEHAGPGDSELVAAIEHSLRRCLDPDAETNAVGVALSVNAVLAATR